MKKQLLLGAGFISLFLGIVGIFLPLLPTTPFFLLTAFCFVRSSDRLYHRLIHNKVIGSYILNYLNYRAVTKKTKIVALLWLWLSLGISIGFLPYTYINWILVAIGMAVSIHVFSLRTFNIEDLTEPSAKDGNERLWLARKFENNDIEGNGNGVLTSARSEAERKQS